MSGAVARLNASSRSIAQRRLSGVVKSRKPKSTGFFTFSARPRCRNTQAHEVSITRSDRPASQAWTSLILLPRRGRGTPKGWRGCAAAQAPFVRTPTRPATSPCGGRDSRIKPPHPPFVAGAVEDQALVQAERAVAPELDGPRREPKARPVWRARHGAK